ncbi:hypothetical protein ACA40_24410 [Pseudomonas syringae pv. lapsa]|uniref:hypothetical protein n=1 Tax=Pseudomonas syringae TaxID=317 RepID=UPI00071115D0|nr:hypothetical protein [Pseudomonas syringae]ALU62840.1 hypothetical protein ACA40_24410 [Pseudomonas syringae pv. lapsa]
MKLFDTAYEVLTKFCPEEFNVKKGCNTVRFGTLYDYRSIDDEKLRDEHEGTFHYFIEFPELTRVSPQWLGSFEVEGGGGAEFDCLEIRQDGPYVRKINLLGACPNCWIYCVSQSASVAGGVTDTHSDSWSIPQENLQELARYFTGLLYSNLTVKDIPQSILVKYSLQEIGQRLSLVTEIQKVEYKDRNVTIAREEDVPVHEIEKLKASVAFTKPTRFQEEREVRIAFWLCFDGKKISVVNNPKIVSLRPIDSIV